MLNIYEEIRIILLRKGLSMRKLAIKMNEENCKVPVEGGLSNSFLKENVKFKTVQQILDFLGYELVIKTNIVFFHFTFVTLYMSLYFI